MSMTPLGRWCQWEDKIRETRATDETWKTWVVKGRENPTPKKARLQA